MVVSLENGQTQSNDSSSVADNGSKLTNQEYIHLQMTCNTKTKIVLKSTKPVPVQTQQQQKNPIRITWVIPQS